MPERPRRPSRRPKGRPLEEDDFYDYEGIFTEDRPTPRKQIGAVSIPVPTLKGRGGRILVGVAILVVVALIAVFVHRQFNPPGVPGAEVTLDVPSGSTISSLGSLLEKKNVIPSGIALRLTAKKDKQESFQAGQYTFHANSSTGDVLRVLAAGPKVQSDRITFQEGLRVRQIADKVGTIKGMSADKFYELATNGSVKSEYQPDGVTSLEGLLFPDTYLLSPSDTEATLLKRMVNEFEAKARTSGLDDSLRRISHTPYEALIIASLIEAEAKSEEDRGKVSQVIENRLYKAMPLQFDTTVLYAMGYSKTYITAADTKIVSPYNTYANTGLPPTPINNPGLSAIKAALGPTPGTWLYFVVIDKNGNAAFATTFAEHQKNEAIARAAGVL